jgi:hypothetical protein
MTQLTEFEKKVYDLIKGQREIQVSDLPMRMLGAIPKLKNNKLIKTYRKPTTPWASKKHTFVKVIEK